VDREDPHDQVHHKDRARHLTRSAGLEVKSRQADHPEAHRDQGAHRGRRELTGPEAQSRPEDLHDQEDLVHRPIRSADLEAQTRGLTSHHNK